MRRHRGIKSLIRATHNVDREGSDELAESYKARIVSRIASPHGKALVENLPVEELDFILPKLLELYLELRGQRAHQAPPGGRGLCPDPGSSRVHARGEALMTEAPE